MDPIAATEPVASSSKQRDKWPGLSSRVRSCIARPPSIPTPVLKKNTVTLATSGLRSWRCYTNREIGMMPCHLIWLEWRYNPHKQPLGIILKISFSITQFYIFINALRPYNVKMTWVHSTSNFETYYQAVSEIYDLLINLLSPCQQWPAVQLIRQQTLYSEKIQHTISCANSPLYHTFNFWYMSGEHSHQLELGALVDYTNS